jgi:hypothetical protein
VPPIMNTFIADLSAGFIPTALSAQRYLRTALLSYIFILILSYMSS